MGASKVARSKVAARWQGGKVTRWEQARWEGSDNRPQVVHIVVLGTDL